MVIVKHAMERDGKSTAVHASLLAQPVALHIAPNLPCFTQQPAATQVHSLTPLRRLQSQLPNQGFRLALVEEDGAIKTQLLQTLLVYPDPGAPRLDQLTSDPIQRLIFLDCTWSQAASLRALPQLQGLRTCRLSREYKVNTMPSSLCRFPTGPLYLQTQFWRPQRGHPDTDLATIEAIYYCLRELSQLRPDSYPMNGCDLKTLMLIYDFFHRRIQNAPFQFPEE